MAQVTGTGRRERGATVVLIVVGLCILAAAVHYRRTHRTPPGSVPLPGRVVDVSVQRSTLSGSGQLLYGVTVEYRDPQTGRTHVLPPDSHQPRAREVGEQVTLLRDPATGEVRLPLPDPRAQMAMPFVLAALVLAAGVVDVLG